jgi:hypothetical protein
VKHLITWEDVTHPAFPTQFRLRHMTALSINIVTCRCIAREQVDKHVSVEMDYWKPRQHFHGYKLSAGISMDTDTLYNRKFRSECSQS